MRKVSTYIDTFLSIGKIQLPCHCCCVANWQRRWADYCRELAEEQPQRAGERQQAWFAVTYRLQSGCGLGLVSCQQLWFCAVPMAANSAFASMG